MRTIAGTAWSADDARRHIEYRVMIVPWSGCWLWEKALLKDGYGASHIPRTLAAGSRSRRAHRLSYEAFTGQIPDGMMVLHKCDVPACCNPEHLFLGTSADNSADMKAKGRQARGDGNGRAKLTESDVRDVLQRLAAGEKQQSIADSLGVEQQVISRIKRRLTWTSITPESDDV